MRLAVFALLAIACSTQERTESSDSAASAAADQDWTGFPNGQCLAAVQSFYPYRFGVSLPVARNSWTGNCAYEGACHIWVDDIPDGDVWERIPNDGSEEPSPYDLIVFPPTSANPWGHIASVDHVTNGDVYVMDANYNSDERRASLPHTVWRPAYGWYHLRWLPKGQQPVEPRPEPPPSLGWCPNNGLYCGGDYISGDPSTLHRCTSHQLTVEQWCPNGCKVNVDGINDECW